MKKTQIPKGKEIKHEMTMVVMVHRLDHLETKHQNEDLITNMAIMKIIDTIWVPHDGDHLDINQWLDSIIKDLMSLHENHVEGSHKKNRVVMIQRTKSKVIFEMQPPWYTTMPQIPTIFTMTLFLIKSLYNLDMDVNAHIGILKKSLAL